MSTNNNIIAETRLLMIQIIVMNISAHFHDASKLDKAIIKLQLVFIVSADKILFTFPLAIKPSFAKRKMKSSV